MPDYVNYQGCVSICGDHFRYADFPVLIRSVPTWITSGLPTLQQQSAVLARLVALRAGTAPRLASEMIQLRDAYSRCDSCGLVLLANCKCADHLILSPRRRRSCFCGSVRNR